MRGLSEDRVTEAVNEVKRLSSINHPNVIKVVDAGMGVYTHQDHSSY